jgi:hypothetical protein
MHDTPLDAHEHAEHAHHAVHDPFASRVTITIAVLAVVAAAAGSLETYESGGAIIEANKAVLAQDRATDEWNLFQAKSLKKNMYAIAADAGGPRSNAYAAKSKDEASGQDEAQTEAKALEKERREDLALSDKHEHRHHRLSVAATLLEIGIAICTIAIITRKQAPWIGAVTLGVLGIAGVALAYLT